MNVTAPAASPEQLNQLMIDAITVARPVGTSDPRVLDAIRTVPRHAFVPGADLADAYNPDLAVITKRGPAGTALSCASVPYLVAAMLQQLDVHDGHRVFEGGAGTGWNAALLATLAGPAGHVSTIDIDPEITAQAAVSLERAGRRPGPWRSRTARWGPGIPPARP
jgi:protein-L-isoaspartate(D-aspartate) O-methyltransferase